MAVDPVTAALIAKGVTGLLGIGAKKAQFEQQQKLNNLRTNIKIQNIEANEQRLIEADLSNNFRIQLNALKALGQSEVSAAFRGISGKSIDEVNNEILSNEAQALNKTRKQLQFQADQLASSEEQILFDQAVFDLQEPDLLSELLGLGSDLAFSGFSMGQSSGATAPIGSGG